MASIYQCTLERPLSAGGREVSVRWVSTKKAVAGNRVTARGFDEVTEKDWVVAEVFNLEQNDQYYFHVIK